MKLKDAIYILWKKIAKIYEWLKGGVETDTVERLKVTGLTGEEIGYQAKASDNTGEVSLMVGTGGINHGIYSDTISDWMLHSDGTDTFIRDRSSRKYCFDMATENTTDTWVPVAKNGVFEHRAIPATYNVVPATTVVNSRNAAATTTTNSTNGIVLATANHTSKTGRVMVIGSANIRTDTQTVRLEIWRGTDNIVSNTTNSKVNTRMVPMSFATCTKNASTTFTLRMIPQAGSTGTMDAYQSYELLILDIHA